MRRAVWAATVALITVSAFHAPVQAQDGAAESLEALLEQVRRQGDETAAQNRQRPPSGPAP